MWRSDPAPYFCSCNDVLYRLSREVCRPCLPCALSDSYRGRAAAAGIRPLGRHGCPVDLSEKHHLELLGTEKSRKLIATRRREDNQMHRRLVIDARSLIYDHGLGIRSAEVERRLSKASLVPTLVRWYAEAVSCTDSG